MTAIPNSNYEFVGWYNSASELISSERIYTLTISPTQSDDIFLRAKFQKTSSPIPVDPSGGGGGGGSGIPSSDTFSGDEFYADTTIGNYAGLYTIWVPTNSQLADFASYLYSDGLLTSVAKLFDKIGALGKSPTDYLFKAFHIPVAIDSKYRITAPNLNFGAYDNNFSSPMDYTQMTAMAISLGSIKLDRIYGNALDYKCKIKLWLPYIDYIELDPADCMGKQIDLLYIISLLTGDCSAIVMVDKEPRYSFSGSMALDMPISEDNSLQNAILNAGAKAANIGSGGVL